MGCIQSSIIQFEYDRSDLFSGRRCRISEVRSAKCIYTLTSRGGTFLITQVADRCSRKRMYTSAYIYIYLPTSIHTSLGNFVHVSQCASMGMMHMQTPGLSLFWIAPPLPSLDARFKFHPPTECCPLPPASRRIAQKLGWHIAWLQPLPSDTRPVVRHR